METVKDVYKAIVAVTAAMAKDGIGKNRLNEMQRYRFRGIDDVYNALSSHLAENNLCILPTVTSNIAREFTTAKGVASIARELTIKFTLVSAVDGSSAEVVTVGEAFDTSDKSANKAMSAAYKYMALMLFAIPTEGDNDADAVTHERGNKKKPETLVGALESSIDFAGEIKTFKERAVAATTKGELLEAWNRISDVAKMGMPKEWLGELAVLKDKRKAEL